MFTETISMWYLHGGYLQGSRVIKMIKLIKIILSIWHLVWQYYMGIDVHSLTLPFIFCWPPEGIFPGHFFIRINVYIFSGT